jgi:hypothetical protein
VLVVAVNVNVHCCAIAAAGTFPRYAPLQLTVAGFAPDQKAGVEEMVQVEASDAK